MKWVLLAVLLLAGVVVAVHIIKVRPTPSSPASSDEIRVNSVVRLDCYPFEVRYSENAREQAVRLAELAKDAYAYFAVVFPGSSRTLHGVIPHARRLEARAERHSRHIGCCRSTPTSRCTPSSPRLG
jgi:hypothetical protein